LEARVAKIVSYVFHPLLMPILALSILFNVPASFSYVLPTQSKVFIGLIVFFNTFVLPLLLSLYLLKRNFIDSLEMATHQERRIPYLITAIFYIATYYILQRANLPSFLYLLMLSATAGLVLTLIVNLKYKISAHMVGVGGVTGSMVAISIINGSDFTFVISLLFLLAGLIGFSRLKLKVHSPFQVYTGFLLGFGSQLILLLLLS